MSYYFIIAIINVIVVAVGYKRQNLELKSESQMEWLQGDTEKD